MNMGGLGRRVRREGNRDILFEVQAEEWENRVRWDRI